MKLINDNFYDNNNNRKNTWNFLLKYENTRKDSILENSIKFGFGDYHYGDKDEYIIVKGIGHFESNDKKYGQAQKIKRNIYEKEIDKSKFIGQKILRSSKSNLNNELNIVVIKDITKDKYHFIYINVENNTSSNINRKLSSHNKINILNNYKFEKEKDLINYLDHINFDYGRIELIKDINLGWCILDINNSPGFGPVSKIALKNILKCFKAIIS